MQAQHYPESTVLTETHAQGEPVHELPLSSLYDRIFTFDRLEEEVVMAGLMKEAVLDPDQLRTTQALAAKLAQGVRKSRLDAGGVDLLTQEFSLDSREGVALMCLAEAMLRVPDTETRNKLIRDKIVDQDWRSHIGKSPSLFVNATAWGLALTGKVLRQPDEGALAAALSNVLRRGGEGVVRAGVSFAMGLLGKQFVTGQTIEEAIGAARTREKLGYCYSYDMLGESALTPADAGGYYEAYAHAIEMVGRNAEGKGPIDGPGMSVKLTGLHPRYEVAQHERVVAEMYPDLLALARNAKKWGIGFHLDQEEEARFPLTLEMLQRLAHEPDLAGWDGLGISLQAYQKRGRALVDWVAALGRKTGRRMLVRLVKGAYWDTEIKRYQSEGAAGFPVFTRKVHSDVSYIACAKALFAAPDAIFPQFATHNAFSIAAVHTLGVGKPYEFQCLHGMGETVYDQVVGAHQLGRACRVYAPVGPHATLVAYLVRRLLENGANTSFVNQVVDSSITIEEIVEDPVAKAALTGGRPHPGIAMPRALLSWREGAATAGAHALAQDAAVAVGAPTPATRGVAAAAVDTAAQEGRSAWSALPFEARARPLIAAAEQLERGAPALQAALGRDSSMTSSEQAAELRTAADLFRFYVAQARADARLQQATPLGPVVVISPASSPLAWPAGQTAAALITGNPVVLKPASSAALTAATMAHLLHACGVPAAALQVVAGHGASLCAKLLTHPNTAAVLIGGSRAVVNEVARGVSRAPHAPVLLARTTGCNTMVVDSTALPEQVISDAVAGAFDGAGLRASSLKLLCLQDSVADKILEMLRGMTNERNIGHADAGACDVGPLPNAATMQAFERYLNRLSGLGHQVSRAGRMAPGVAGNFTRPAIVELGSVDALRFVDHDIAGPVLHVVRWRAGKLADLLAGLDLHVAPATLGLHTRISETAGEVVSLTRAGGVYVNRAVHLARPGMQVESASAHDIGPSPSGPFYLHELVRGEEAGFERGRGPFAQQPGIGSATYLEYPQLVDGRLRKREHQQAATRRERMEMLEALLAAAPSNAAKESAARLLPSLYESMGNLAPLTLPALTGEENTLLFEPKGPVLCMGPSVEAVLSQVMTAVACGDPVILPRTPDSERYAAVLGVCQLVDYDQLFSGDSCFPVAVLTGATGGPLNDLRIRVADGMGGRFVPLVTPHANGRYPWWRLVAERQITVNVSASGGNAQLMIVEDEAV